MELPEGSREYMAATLLLPALELAIDEMLRVCVGEVEAGQKPDPIRINFLATHLLRNNPHHDATAASRLAAHVKRRAAEDAAMAAAARRKPPKPHLSDEDAAVRLEAVQRGHKARLVVQHKRTMAALPPPRLAPTKSGAAIALQAARRGRAGREKAEHRAAAARLAPPPLPWADPEGRQRRHVAVGGTRPAEPLKVKPRERGPTRIGAGGRRSRRRRPGTRRR